MSRKNRYKYKLSQERKAKLKELDEALARGEVPPEWRYMFAARDHAIRDQAAHDLRVIGALLRTRKADH
jgi:hypothetical protein